MTDSPIFIANNRMRIEEACSLLGMSVIRGKMYCPFGEVNHPDGGNSKSFRVYPLTNSAYCFACAERFTPVKLISMDRDISYADAADWILLHTKYVAPTWEAQYNAALASEEFETSYLADELTSYAASLSKDWEILQYEEIVSSALTKCLKLLDSIHNTEDAERWLSVSKKVMQKVLLVS